MAEAIYCIRHPTTETNLSCGRCGEAVCPRCLVHAPVGVRCPECAEARPLPTFDVTPVIIARGLGAGVAIAFVGGVISSIAINFLPATGLPLNVLTAVAAAMVAGLGLVVGEGISLAVNRKRGKRLKLVVAASMFVGITVITFVTQGATFNTLILLAAGLSFYIAISRF